MDKQNRGFGVEVKFKDYLANVNLHAQLEYSLAVGKIFHFSKGGDSP